MVLPSQTYSKTPDYWKKFHHSLLTNVSVVNSRLTAVSV